MIRRRPSFKIKMFQSIPAFSYCLQMWEEGKESLLFLTGLSGSGKTSFAHELESIYNCTVISLDALRFYESASLNSKEMVDRFAEQYPQIRSSISLKWDYGWFNMRGEREYTKFTRLYIQFIDKYAHSTQNRYIVEGIQLFVRVPSCVLADAPKIIVGTSGWTSFLQAMHRDVGFISPANIFILLHRFLRYSVIQRYRLNRYLLHWRKEHPQRIYQKRQSIRNVSPLRSDEAVPHAILSTDSMHE